MNSKKHSEDRPRPSSITLRRSGLSANKAKPNSSEITTDWFDTKLDAQQITETDIHGRKGIRINIDDDVSTDVAKNVGEK
ncbi:hypothetical protein [Pseudomonas sp. S1_A02]